MGHKDNSNQVKYCSSNSVLVINPAGKLKQVFTPFRVTEKIERQRQRRRWFSVEEVRSTEEGRLVYMIGGQAYYHSRFTIEVQF